MRIDAELNPTELCRFLRGLACLIPVELDVGTSGAGYGRDGCPDH
jgi:hypothetical protein